MLDQSETSRNILSSDLLPGLNYNQVLETRLRLMHSMFAYHPRVKIVKSSIHISVSIRSIILECYNAHRLGEFPSLYFVHYKMCGNDLIFIHAQL